jgi:hypothetical protein
MEERHCGEKTGPGVLTAFSMAITFARFATGVPRGSDVSGSKAAAAYDPPFRASTSAAHAGLTFPAQVRCSVRSSRPAARTFSTQLSASTRTTSSARLHAR